MAFRGLAPITGTTMPALISWLNQLRDRFNNNLLTGKINATVDITLTANSATTALTNPLLSGMSGLYFCPLTSNAAGALSSLYVSAQGSQTATLTHANTATTDRNFRLLVIG